MRTVTNVPGPWEWGQLLFCPPKSSCCGIALASVLFFLGGLTILSATVFLVIFLDGEATSNLTSGDDALYVAEAGLHELWSMLVPEPDFAQALSWPDGAPPFDSPMWFPEPPRTFRVHVTAASAGGLVATSEGTSHGGARRRVEGTFSRQREFRPLSLLVVSPSTDVVTSGSLELSGGDRDEIEPPLLPLGAENRRAGDLMASGSQGRFVPAIVGPSGLAAAAAALRESPDRTVSGPFDGQQLGNPAAPEVVRLTGDGEVRGDLRVYGILVADVLIRVEGHLEVEGLMLAGSGLDVDGTATIHGALWISDSLRISSSGAARVDYASAALDRADRLRPGVLPRIAILGAWREVW